MKHFTLGFAALLFFACSNTKKVSGEKDYQVLANELAQKFIILDGHVDLPFRLKVSNFRLEKEFIGIPIASQEGDFDYERAKKRRLGCTIYVHLYSCQLSRKWQSKILSRFLD